MADAHAGDGARQGPAGDGAASAAPRPPAPSALSDEALLYGHDPYERLVALHPVETDGPGETMRLYVRTREDRVETEDVPFHPFFFLSDDRLLDGFPRQRYRIRRLDGEGFFRHAVAFPTRAAYWDAVRHVERQSGSEKERPDAVYFCGGPEQQYLTQTGRTLFKGMDFSDLHRLQLDIEVAAENAFPNADVPDHAVIIVSLSDNRGWTRLIDARQMSEADVLRETVAAVRERDPDVLEAHNGYSFDWPYLRTRCQMHGVRFALGRDGSEPRFFPSSMRFAERSIEFEAMEVAGRHVVDTLFQVMAYDVFKRDLPNYTLKGAARYFGFAPEGRTYVEGAEIARVWREDPERLLAYALDDVIETERLARHLSGSTFYLAQMVPMPYGQAARTGPAAKIEALFVRGYLRARHSLPRAEWGSQAVGGYTDVFTTGVVGPIVYADVESLYPSIMLNYGVQPGGDGLGLFPRLLQTLTTLRLETKAAMKGEADVDARGELDARQTAYKNVINCFDAETEILTVGGLKRVAELEVGDAVYALDPKTLRVEVKPVVQTFCQAYRGPMVRLESRHVDFLVTPHHKLLTSRFVSPGYRPYAWEYAGDLLVDRVRRKLPPHPSLPGRPAPATIRLDGLCDRHGITGYVVADGVIRSAEKNAKAHPVEYATADWLALVGWYASEGHTYRSTPKRYANGHRRGVYHSVGLGQKRPEGRAGIAALLHRMGVAHTTDVNGLSFRGRLFCDVLEAECGRGSAEKRLPPWVFELEPEALRPLFEALMAGDGNATRMRYTTKSDALARDFVRLCHHLGVYAYPMEHDGCHRIAVNTSRGAAPVLKAEHRSVVDFDGEVYCVEVADHHTVLAGRNGKLNWCGQSFYGNLGFGMAIFNDFAEADRVAAIGQGLLRGIIGRIREAGGRVVEVDTDGVLFVPPPGIEGEEAERAFVRGLSDAMPQGIRIGFDGRAQKMLSYKKKNYALLDYDGGLKFKGSSLVSRSIEGFGRRFVREAIRLLLAEDVAGLHALYLDTRRKITRHDWSGVEEFQRVETIKASVDDYEREVADGKRPRAATYELAKAREAATGRAVRVGDRVAYYIAKGAGGPMRAFEAARWADEWDPAAPDEHTAYYLERLDQFAARFEAFFESPHGFRQVFSEEDLFGFDPRDIRLKVTERPPEEVEDDVPF